MISGGERKKLLELFLTVTPRETLLGTLHNEK